MATKVDLDVWRGSARELIFTVYAQTGGLRDVSGWTVRFNVRDSHDASGTRIALSTLTSGVSLSNPTAGEITVALTGSQTGGVPAGSYRYTLGRVDSGSETVLAEGAFRLKANSVLPT